MRPTGVEGLFAEFTEFHFWQAVPTNRRVRLHSVNYAGVLTTGLTGNREVILTFQTGAILEGKELLQFGLGPESRADEGSGTFEIPEDGILFDEGILIVADNGTATSTNNTKGIKFLSLTVQM